MPQVWPSTRSGDCPTIARARHRATDLAVRQVPLARNPVTNPRPERIIGGHATSAQSYIGSPAIMLRVSAARWRARFESRSLMPSKIGTKPHHLVFVLVALAVAQHQRPQRLKHFFAVFKGTASFSARVKRTVSAASVPALRPVRARLRLGWLRP